MHANCHSPWNLCPPDDIAGYWRVCPMPSPDLDHFAPTAPANRILAALPPEEMAVLQPHLEALPLPIRFTLYEEDRPIEHVYFLNRGVVSVLSLAKEGTPV